VTIESDALRRESDLSEQTGVSDATIERVRQWEAEIASSLGPAQQLMLDLAGVGPGSRVLDIAAGRGGQTMVAAERVGPAGSVLAIDHDGEALAAAAALARRSGLRNVETRVMDATCIDLESDTFDAAISRVGLEFISPLDDALRGIRRVLKSRARLAAVVWSSAEKNPRVAVPLAIARRYTRLQPSAPGQAGMFSLGSAGVLHSAFVRAGFHDVSVRQVPTLRRFPSMAEVMHNLRDSFPLLREVMADLNDAERLLAWLEIGREIRQFQGPCGVEIPGELLVGVGTKP
jgi:ubiquinone/menaquinone biosynthesis C-methylase UbiE